MGDAGAEHAKAGEAVLRGEALLGVFEAVERGFELRLAGAELFDGAVARKHDLADFVAGNIVGGDDLPRTIPSHYGIICVKHCAQRPIDIQRHDYEFQKENGQNVDDTEHDEKSCSDDPERLTVVFIRQPDLAVDSRNRIFPVEILVRGGRAMDAAGVLVKPNANFF